MVVRRSFTHSLYRIEAKRIIPATIPIMKRPHNVEEEFDNLSEPDTAIKNRAMPEQAPSIIKKIDNSLRISYI
ncbi:MAG: hypothetical protein KJ666_12590 [Bacteroidetes bacterium]|nr:hypothetical protein [Bacteroidota bacterium]MBU2584974.1 hypothetical protein [Bacteroidota bacterium]